MNRHQITVSLSSEDLSDDSYHELIELLFETAEGGDDEIEKEVLRVIDAVRREVRDDKEAPADFDLLDEIEGLRELVDRKVEEDRKRKEGKPSHVPPSEVQELEGTPGKWVKRAHEIVRGAH